MTSVARRDSSNTHVIRAYAAPPLAGKQSRPQFLQAGRQRPWHWSLPPRGKQGKGIRKEQGTQKANWRARQTRRQERNLGFYRHGTDQIGGAPPKRAKAAKPHLLQ